LEAAQCGLTDGMTKREVLAIRLAEAVTETPGEVNQELFRELREEFGEEQLVELTSAFAWKNYLARFNRVYDIPEDEYPG
jgi:alkylhydroperoxidase family enzyme